MTILGRSEELVSRCIECDLAEPESLASLGGSAPGVVDGILSVLVDDRDWFYCSNLSVSIDHGAWFAVMKLLHSFPSNPVGA